MPSAEPPGRRNRVAGPISNSDPSIWRRSNNWIQLDPIQHSRGVPQGPQLLSVGRFTDHPPVKGRVIFFRSDGRDCAATVRRVCGVGTHRALVVGGYPGWVDVVPTERDVPIRHENLRAPALQRSDHKALRRDAAVHLHSQEHNTLR
eukprot:1191077-Prorocentrum_minimum.AAC.4